MGKSSINGPFGKIWFLFQWKAAAFATNKRILRVWPINPTSNKPRWSQYHHALTWRLGLPCLEDARFATQHFEFLEDYAPKILQDGNPRTWRKLIFPWIWQGYRSHPQPSPAPNGIVPGLPGMSMAGELGDKISRDWWEKMEGETPEITVCTIF